MSFDDTHGPDESTSAAGAMLRQLREPLLVSAMLAGLGTSTAPALPTQSLHLCECASRQTSAGLTVAAVERAGSAIAELRRLSGLTWDQLSRLFQVSRRALHFWASGEAMAAANEEHLQRLLGVLRKVDRGSASTNRAALLGAGPDGAIPFDLLAEGQYDTAAAILGEGERVPRIVAPPLSEDARRARMPPPPETLVGALQDRVHRDLPGGRAARSVRTRGGR